MNSRIDNTSDEIKPNLCRVGGGSMLMENTAKHYVSPSRKRSFFAKFIALSLVLFTAIALAGATTVQAANESGKHVVVLDAGHGGRDPGAVDLREEYAEADIVHNMAERIGRYLENHEDIEVVYTRGANEYVGIKERAAVANRAGADMLVSLHLNAAENASAQGFQIFPATPGRENHAESLQLAEDILPHVREIGRPVRGINGVFYAYYQGGEKIFYDANEYNGASSLSSFGVLENADCAAVLVESWFITNSDDMQFFNNEQGMDLMSRQLYRGICTNLDIAYKA